MRVVATGKELKKYGLEIWKLFQLEPYAVELYNEKGELICLLGELPNQLKDDCVIDMSTVRNASDKFASRLVKEVGMV